MAKLEDSISAATVQAESFSEVVGQALVKGFHLLALFAIGGSIVWSAVFAFEGMVRLGQATIEDVLLLFIYLELGAMVGIYFETRRMPVRFLIYVAITALTRRVRLPSGHAPPSEPRTWRNPSRQPAVQARLKPRLARAAPSTP